MLPIEDLFVDVLMDKAGNLNIFAAVGIELRSYLCGRLDSDYDVIDSHRTRTVVTVSCPPAVSVVQ